MAQGGERESGPTGGESLLDNPYAIVERIEELVKLEGEERREAEGSFSEWVLAGSEEVDKEIREAPWRIVLSTCKSPMGEYLVGLRRELHLDRHTSISEEKDSATPRKVELRYNLTPGNVLVVDFTYMEERVSNPIPAFLGIRGQWDQKDYDLSIAVSAIDTRIRGQVISLYDISFGGAATDIAQPVSAAS